MTKAELEKLLSNHFGFTQIESEMIMNFIIDIIKEELRRGRRVLLTEFCSFVPKRRKKFVYDFKSKSGKMQDMLLVKVKFSRRFIKKLNS